MATSQLRSFVITGVVMFGLFIAGVSAMFLFAGQGPQDNLTERVPADVLHVGKGQSRNQVIRYEYRYDGHTYYVKQATRYEHDDWRTSQDLWLCIDPDEPEQNAPLFDDGPPCGDDDLRNPTKTAARIR